MSPSGILREVQSHAGKVLAPSFAAGEREAPWLNRESGQVLPQTTADLASARLLDGGELTGLARAQL